jgi:hypothetical protein
MLAICRGLIVSGLWWRPRAGDRHTRVVFLVFCE